MNNFRNFAVWIVIALLLFALFSLFQGQAGRTNTKDVDYSYLKARAAAGEVASITYSGDAGVAQLIQAQLTNKTTIQAYGPVTETDLKDFEAKGIAIKFQPAQGDSFLTSALIYWLPTLLLIGVWVFFIRQMQSGRRQGHGLW